MHVPGFFSTQSSRNGANIRDLMGDPHLIHTWAQVGSLTTAAVGVFPNLGSGGGICQQC